MDSIAVNEVVELYYQGVIGGFQLQAYMLTVAWRREYQSRASEGPSRVA